MKNDPIAMPPVEPMTANHHSAADAEPYAIQAHHLLCAVCARAGYADPPCGRKAVAALLEALWSYPFLPLLIQADVDVARAHYAGVYEQCKEHPLPTDFAARNAAAAERRKDLEVCRLLGIYPNTVLPAYHAYLILFSRLPTLEGMCCALSGDTAVLPECPNARSGGYERIVSAPRTGLQQQNNQGEELAGEGIWAMVRPRTRQEMHAAKQTSAAFIREKAQCLYIRPAHALCILCTRQAMEPLNEDNLVELRQRMEADPGIPVTLSEGCCMVCDPCNVYHPGEHLCYHAHPKNVLRDLRMLEILGLAPGTTLPARELYRRIFEKIPHCSTVCGWGDGSDTTPFWAPCGSWQTTALEDARAEGFLQDNCEGRL